MRAFLILVMSLVFSLTSLAQENNDQMSVGVFDLTPEAIDAVSGRLEEALAKITDPEQESLAFELMGSDQGYNLFVVLRGNTGTSEIHRTVSDLHTALKGKATLVVGGELVDEYELSPGQMRGASITGGREYLLKAGDAIHIPANVPHHVVVAPGEKYMYFVYQVDSAQLK